MNFLLSSIAASLMLLGVSCKDRKEITAGTTDPSPQAGVISKEEYSAPREQQKQEDRKIRNQQEYKTPGKYDGGWDKKIIKTATLQTEVKDFRKYSDKIHELVPLWEGYIAKEEEKDNDYKREGVLTIKVPVSRFDEAINSITSLQEKLLLKQITSEDVTSEVMDIRARMEAKKRIRLRYLDMLDKAKNMEEILQVEREINNIQEQIEAAEGRLDYLTHTSAYSTIELTFYKILEAPGIGERPGFARRMVLALNEGLKWVGEFLIFFVTLWPVWMALLIIIILLKREKMFINRGKTQ
jgi:hypothetical protein